MGVAQPFERRQAHRVAARKSWLDAAALQESHPVHGPAAGRTNWPRHGYRWIGRPAFSRAVCEACSRQLGRAESQVCRSQQWVRFVEWISNRDVDDKAEENRGQRILSFFLSLRLSWSHPLPHFGTWRLREKSSNDWECFPSHSLTHLCNNVASAVWTKTVQCSLEKNPTVVC